MEGLDQIEDYEYEEDNTLSNLCKDLDGNKGEARRESEDEGSEDEEEEEEESK